MHIKAATLLLTILMTAAFPLLVKHTFKENNSSSQVNSATKQANTSPKVEPASFE